MTAVLVVVLAAGTLLACRTSSGGADALTPARERVPAPSGAAPGGDAEAQGAAAPLTSGRTSGSVGFRTSYEYSDGVAVAVSRIVRTTGRKARVAGVKKGAAVQLLSVRLSNGSDQPLRLAPRAEMTYGSTTQRVARVRGGSYPRLSGWLPAGASHTRTLVFAVPAKHLHRATLRLTPTAEHTPAVFSGSLGYTPSSGVLFNDPTGSKADQLRITRHIERSIDGAPGGSTIRIAQYSFDIESAAKKLVAAHRRGVHIQMIVDQHDQKVTKQTMTLIELLGSNPKKKSFLVRCGASCMSNRASTMHAKFYLFSAVGSAEHVSMVGSANITHTNSKGSWNDMQTFVGDATLYTSLKRYFDDMAPDDNDRHYYRTTTSGPVTLYFFPRAEKHRVLLLEALDGVSCSRPAAGYGRGGRTLVQVTMYSWRVPRMDIAKKLWRLHDAGCEVQIILNRSRTDLAVKQVLARRSAKHGVMDLYDAWVDRNGNDVADRYMHQKGITISGAWNGRKDAKVVYSGSQNLAPLSTTDNNELVLRREGDAVYDAYATNFGYAVEHGTQRLY